MGGGDESWCNVHVQSLILYDCVLSIVATIQPTSLRKNIQN